MDQRRGSRRKGAAARRGQLSGPGPPKLTAILRSLSKGIGPAGSLAFPGRSGRPGTIKRRGSRRKAAAARRGQLSGPGPPKLTAILRSLSKSGGPAGAWLFPVAPDGLEWISGGDRDGRQLRRAAVSFPAQGLPS
ncbi:hypothetical protein B9G55_23805 [Saccharibacillus sp. O16]|nr:hypothetical protein B9G55_23805 [Saccharibacillus sp. O16]